MDTPACTFVRDGLNPVIVEVNGGGRLSDGQLCLNFQSETAGLVLLSHISTEWDLNGSVSHYKCKAVAGELPSKFATLEKPIWI